MNTEETKTGATIDDTDPKLEALAKYLEVEPSELSQSKYDECTYELGNQEYLVLTDSEADERAKAECLDSLWAFNSEFLAGCISNDDHSALVASLRAIQEKMCESCNPTIKAMLGENLDSMIDDAILTDGRGHFLSHYDGNENEQGKFFIYRTN
jgi:hypothetical protein